MSQPKAKPINKILFKVARSKMATAFIGFAFRYLTAFMPLSKLNENQFAIAFYHPSKHWEEHCLVVPKKAVPSLMSLDLKDEHDQHMLQNILLMAVQTATDLKLETYTVLVNGNAYQDVPQLHFHVASGLDRSGKPLGLEEPSAEQLAQAAVHKQEAGWQIYELQKDEPFHQTVFVSASEPDDFSNLDQLTNLFSLIQTSIRSFPFKGFTVVFNKSSNSEQDRLLVNLVGELKP